MAKMEKINCAAIKRSDNIIIAGRNHAFVFQHSPKGTCGQNSEQGFITSNARFVGRTEAADIAFEAGQIKKPTNVLFSEDITGDNPWAGEIIEQLRASHPAEVILDDVRVPGSLLLGGKERLDERLARAREGKVSRSQAAMATFEATRPTVAAQAVGIARAAYEYALDYAKEREQFGRAIIENQAIAFMLADMRTEIDAARLLVWRAANMGATGQSFEAGEGSMSKLKAGRVAVWVTERAIQVMGGAGYVRDHPVERWHRDAKIYDIFEGTEQIQQLVVSRAISGMRIE